MRTSTRILLGLSLCVVPAVTVRASIAPAAGTIGQCLPVIITGQGVALQQDTVVAVVIDIQPNRTPNRIYLGKNYTIYVAVFGSDKLAIEDLDPGTVAFGSTGEEADPVRPPVIRDINGDGLDDALFGFLTFDCGFKLGDMVGWLRGATTDETVVEGSNAVVVSP